MVRNWGLAKKTIEEQQKHISPWRRVHLGWIWAAFGKFILTMFLLVAGIIVSAETKDWAWFSRFGCLIAVLGLFAVITNIQEALAGKSRKHQSGVDEGTQAEQEAQEIVGFVRAIDLAILVIGNLIWGFGDLIGKLVQR